MGLNLDKIIFVPSGAEGSTIGSHILAGDDGTAIGHVSDALKVSIANASIAVTGTFFQATQPVSATNLDIRDLVFATDKVDVSGSTVSFTPSGASNAVYGVTSVTTTATKIIATNLASRLSVIVQNLGAKDMFFGDDASITTANTIKVPSGGSVELSWGPGIDLYGITASGTADVRYLQSA
jgi:hypothetical protein